MATVVSASGVEPAEVNVPCPDEFEPVKDQFQVKARAAFSTASAASEAAAAKATGKRIAKEIESAAY